MKKHFVLAAKLLVVAALMWWVFQSIPFDDRLVYRDPATDKVVATEIILIDGDWRQSPVPYRVGNDDTLRTATRGEQPDGRTLDVEPGFLSYWRNLDPSWFALAALCYCLTVMIAGARWWWLLRVNGTDVSLLETLRFTWIGIFFNTVMPGSTGGDVIKALYIMKRCPGHRVQVLVSVGVDRILGLGSLALLGAVCVLFALDRFAEIALSIWGVIVGVGLLGVFAFSRRLRSLIRLNDLLNRLPHKLRGMLQMVDRAVFSYRNHRMVIAASLLAGMLNHVIAVLCVVCIGKAIGVGMPVFEYFVLVPVINILSALPIAPMGWGIGEAAYGILFGTHGAAYLGGGPAAAAAMHTRGVAVSVLYRLMLTAISLLGGLFLLFEKDKVTQADIDREVALEEKEGEGELPEDGVEPDKPAD